MGISKTDGFNKSIAGGLRGKTIFPVKVKHIILNGTTEFAKYYGGYDAVGTIFFNKQSSRKKATQDGKQSEKKDTQSYDGYAKPLFMFQKQYPLINETVLIIQTISKNYLLDPLAVNCNYYLPPINLWNHPHHNNLPSIENYTDKEKTSVRGYEKEGLVRRVTDGEGDYEIPLGDYFKEQLNIKPLLPYEGDHILEGRYGNSIRFGATARHDIIPKENKDIKGWTAKNEWSKGTKGDIGDPITIIRNGQRVAWSDEELGGKGWVHTLEDINWDPSSIYLTSNQKINNFLISSTNWQTYGVNAVIPQSDQKEAQKFINNSVEHMTGEPIEDLGGGDEQEGTETEKTTNQKNADQSQQNEIKEEKKSIQCDNGKWKWGEEGECIYESEESATATNTDSQGNQKEEQQESTHESIGESFSLGGSFRVDIRATNKETGAIDISVGGESEGEEASLEKAYNIAKNNFENEKKEKEIIVKTPTIDELISKADEKDVYGNEDKKPRYYQKVNDSEELEEIDSKLPENYRITEFRSGKNCGDCDFYKLEGDVCSKWEGAKVRGRDSAAEPAWICNSFKKEYIDWSKSFPKKIRLTTPQSLNESKVYGTLQWIDQGFDTKLTATLYVPDPYIPSSINVESESYMGDLKEEDIKIQTDQCFGRLVSQIRQVYELDMEGRIELGEPLPFTEEVPKEKNWDNFKIVLDLEGGMWSKVFDPLYDNLSPDAPDGHKLLYAMRNDIKPWENTTGNIKVLDKYSLDPDNYMSGVGSSSNSWETNLSGLPGGKTLRVSFPFYSGGAIPEVLDPSDFHLSHTVNPTIEEEYNRVDDPKVRPGPNELPFFALHWKVIEN